MELEQIVQILLLILLLFGGVIGQAIQRKRRPGGQERQARTGGEPGGSPTPEGEIARRVREMLEAARAPQAAPAPPRAPIRRPAPVPPTPSRARVELQPRPAAQPALGIGFEQEFTQFKNDPSTSWAEREDSLLATPRKSIHDRVHPMAAALRALLQKDPRLTVLGYELLGTPPGLRGPQEVGFRRL